MDPMLPHSIHPMLHRYLELLERWNRTHALTALAPEERWEELLLDASALLPFMPPGPARVVDLGTGMGIPAVLIAVARPDLQVIGVDKVAKKTAFVRQAALELGLSNLEVRTGRFEEIPPLEGDVGVAKAVGELELLLGWWRRHGKPGSPFLALKGPQWVQEPLPPGYSATPHPYHLPSRGERFVLVIQSKLRA